MKILCQVSGSGVAYGEIYFRDNSTGLTHAQFAEENNARMSLRSFIAKHWGSPNTIVVEDVEFRSGYYAVTTSGGSHGFSSYQLHKIMTPEQEAAAFSMPGGHHKEVFRLAGEFDRQRYGVAA